MEAVSLMDEKAKKRHTQGPTDLTGTWVGYGIWEGQDNYLELTTQDGQTTGWAMPGDGSRVPLVVHLEGSAFNFEFPSESENTCKPVYSGEVTADGVLRGECCNQASVLTPLEFRKMDQNHK
jgi:hypothetical protein